MVAVKAEGTPNIRGLKGMSLQMDTRAAQSLKVEFQQKNIKAFPYTVGYW